MAKEIEVANEDGTTSKETVYSTEEYTAATGVVTKLEADLAEARRINMERGNDFKAFSKMTEEEKKVYDANTLNLLRREENLTNQLTDLSTKLTDKEKKENDSAKNNALTNLHHGDEASKKLLEEKYALLTGMPETTAEEINAKAGAAAKLAGIQIDPRNPLYTQFNGEAPKYNADKQFVDTPAGAAAAAAVRAAMGLPEVK